MKEKKQNLSFGIATLIIVLFLTIGYSAFERNLLIDDIALTVRPIEDIRVTGTWQKESTNGAESNSVDYNVKSSLLSFNLPKESSTITYTVQVTNIGNVDMGILKITGLPENMEYELTNYKLKEKICTDERCSRGIQKEFQITIKYKSGGYKSSNTTYDIKLDYDFQRVWGIKYDGFDEEEIKDMPTEVLNSDTLVLLFDESIIKKISVKMNDEDFQDYKVEKGTITIENVTGDITIIKEIEIIVDFDYDEDNLEQTYIVPVTGYYKLEVWGAQGGTTDVNSDKRGGGSGGYSVGAAYLEKGQILYINIGGQGLAIPKTPQLVKGGYNGGGDGTGGSNLAAASGGGATHIALSSGELSTLSEKIGDILIVAGGGAGGTYVTIDESGWGGNGGGLNGSKGTFQLDNKGGGTGGAQGYGGFSNTYDSFGFFGQGGSKTTGGPGGGGGYYGGGAGWAQIPGGGGSGYIGGVTDYDDVVAKTTAGGRTGNGKAKITLLKAQIIDKTEEKFYYTGGEQTYVVPTTGYYKLEVWGAQGGTAGGIKNNIVDIREGGSGGYSVGAVYLEAGQKLYINVGGVGSIVYKTAELVEGGYNGGGSGFGVSGVALSSGGGATHIALSSGELSTLSEKTEDILIVAGGGAGSSYGATDESGWGGAGGGSNGSKGTFKLDNNGGGTGGTQGYGGFGSSNGSLGFFGQGGNNTSNGSGGGGGYYGGGAGWTHVPGGGGSGYIGGVIDYDDIIAKTTAGGHAGAGSAKITFLKAEVVDKKTEKKFYYTGGEQTYVVPTTGYYKLEVWGAQGGTAAGIKNSIVDIREGGKGGYSIGAVYLEKGQTLYINVGGVGSTVYKAAILAKGGYNGGGNGSGLTYATIASGGGATHIATAPGELSTLSEKRSDILIVAGGGAGSSYSATDESGWGGAGGGTNGSKGTLKLDNSIGAGGGTQNGGGTSSASNGQGSFGQGGSNITGGGGGYYGGGAGWTYVPGGGGSGYIGGVTSYSDITVRTAVGYTMGNGHVTITFISE